MSLFKARDWWSAKFAHNGEEFDKGCLAVGNLDPADVNSHQIVVGSHTGLLRIFAPQARGGGSGEGGAQSRSEEDQEESMWLEYDAHLPILQVAIGRFVAAVERNHIAVLHPRKLVVFGVNASAGSTAHGSQWQVRTVYEHALHRTAFNFTFGPFGRVSDKDLLCVQSVDGALSIFEQESFAFTRFLPDSLLPGPLAYVPSTDSFLTVSSLRQAETYKYQMLAVAADVKSKEEAQALKSGKRVKCDWAFNLGETAVDIQVFQEQFLMILGRRNLYCLSETGKLRWMMRLDFPTDCLHVYDLRDTESLLYLLTSSGGEILVYQNTLLRWAARMEQNDSTVDIRVGNFPNLRGSLVALGGDGRLQALYLGTDPSATAGMTAAARPDLREVDYEGSDQELVSLQQRIKVASGRAQPMMPAARAVENELRITIELPRGLDDTSQAGEVQLPANESATGEPSETQPATIRPPSCTASLRLRPKSHMNNVQLHIDVRQPLSVNQSHFFFSYIDTNHAGDCVASFYMSAPYTPSDLTVRLVASYTNTAGTPRVCQASFALPIALVVAPCLPQKQAQYKLTVDTNKPPANLETLFSELRLPNVDSQGSALGFQYFGNGPVVTMLASKTSQRYRLQADTFDALWLLTKELVSRLESSYGSSFQASFTSQLPLSDFFEVLDGHFETRSNLKELQQLVAQRAEQFRAIQRRLLTRFKDKTPAPLQNLDSLLEGSMRQLIQMADMVEEGKRHLQRTSCSLNAATSLLCYLVQLTNSLSAENFSILQNVLSGALSDYEEVGIEETIDAALTHMLRSVLTKAAKDVQLSSAPLTMPKDPQRLKKHVHLLCERLGKGVQLAPSGEPEATSTTIGSTTNTLAPMPIVKEAGEGDGGGLLTMENKFAGFRSPRGDGEDGERKRKKKKKKKKQKEPEAGFKPFEPNMNEDQLSQLPALKDLDQTFAPFGAPMTDTQEDYIDSKSHRNRYINEPDADFYG